MWPSHFGDDVLLGVSYHYFRERGGDLRPSDLAVSG
jgi:hypothetical protein